MRTLKKYLKKSIGRPFLMDGLSRVCPSVVIVLGFHDVCEDNGLSSWLRVKRSTFADTIKLLEKHCHFIHPDDLFDRESLSRRRLNLLVTFDDGFVNNYRVAMPILKDLGVPALFFVSTSNLQQQSLFWFDHIVIPIQAARLDHLDLSEVGLGNYVFESTKDPSRRWDSINRLLVDIKKLGNPEIPAVKRVLYHVGERFRKEIDSHKDEFRPMNPDEVRLLAQDPLFRIGSHSHEHVILTRLDTDALDANLTHSKAILEGMTQRAVNAFAFPNGDTNTVVTNRMHAAGYQLAYGTHAFPVSASTNRYDIPRVLIGAYDSLDDIVGKLVRVLIRYLRVAHS